jgi:hypothetical protein
MEALYKNDIPTITLDVRISCETFWNYNFRIPIRISDYYNRNERNINRGLYNEHMNNSTDTCHIGNIGRRDPMFCRLEEYLVDYVIQHIYDDLMSSRQHRDIPILLKKARKFHIHGRTLENILFPYEDVGGGDKHVMPENTVYICTHC